MPIDDEKIGDFLGRLAGRVPVPGAAAAAAMHAAQAAALLGMVARYGAAAGSHPGHAAAMGRIIARTDEVRAIALRLADADADAFAAVASAYRLPRSTGQGRTARDAALAHAVANAAWPTVQVIGVAGIVVDLAEALAEVGEAAVISEVAAAAEAARAAAATARVSVEAGLADVTDEQAGLEMIAEAGKAGDVISRAERLTAAVRAQIRA